MNFIEGGRLVWWTVWKKLPGHQNGQFFSGYIYKAKSKYNTKSKNAIDCMFKSLALTDAESRIMLTSSNGWQQAYNLQSSVDMDSYMIFGGQVAQKPIINSNPHLF